MRPKNNRCAPRPVGTRDPALGPLETKTEFSHSLSAQGTRERARRRQRESKVLRNRSNSETQTFYYYGPAEAVWRMLIDISLTREAKLCPSLSRLDPAHSVAGNAA